jgi:predicted nucleotidyltransferase
MIHDKRLPTDVIQKLPRLIERVKGFECVQALFFFGSLAMGELKPLSDLDLAILVEKDMKGNELLQCRFDLEAAVSETLATDELDLVILNTAPLRFAYQILKHGRLVLVKDREQLIDFRERVVKLYLDFSSCRRSFDRTFMQGIGARG